MAIEAAGALGPVAAIALVGALGVGSQWLAWRLHLPAIVLMLVAGILIGPVAGILDPQVELGSLVQPLVALAVAVILFEGGITLDFRKLGDAGTGVLRLVLIGAPLGWLLSTLALRYGAGLSWEAATVFGGIMIVTGPTVIAPLLRQARLQRRPAALLQWEAIVNDPIGAMAAVVAFQTVLAMQGGVQPGYAMTALGIGFATAVGFAAGQGLVYAFKRSMVPEYMKVPVLFASVLGAFAVSDRVLHESGLLAVTVMGLVIANANLPSYEELRRFKEQATVLLVSGIFILLAASLDFQVLGQLTWRAALFVAAVVLLARPLTVLISLVGTGLPWNERLLIAFTGPRGVVLIAVAGLFGERLAEAGVADGALVAPLAFALVAATVVLHGFTLAPMARWLGLSGGEAPGVLFVGGSRFTNAFATLLQKANVPVMITDPNHGSLAQARQAGLPTFYGDILGEAAEHSVELLAFKTVVAATENDAYNTLVTADLAPEFGRDQVWRLARSRESKARHALPVQLGGRSIGEGRDHDFLEQRIRDGWKIGQTRLTAEFDLAAWRTKRPEAVLLATLDTKDNLSFVTDDTKLKSSEGLRILSLIPPDPT
ncbi:MAG: sodium:proton antiporter [Tabrizicola sp.]|nr:sodium:proton antiporter [Tabrizicola sp.]